LATYIAVRTLQQLVERDAVLRIDGDADARRDAQDQLADPARRRDRVEQLGRDRRDLLLVADVDQQADELVAAVAADRVAGTHRTFETLRHHLQQVVADGMAVSVVDRLEAVEVDVEQAELVGVRLAATERLARTLVERRAVREAGQVVVVCRVEREPFAAPGLRHRATGVLQLALHGLQLAFQLTPLADLAVDEIGHLLQLAEAVKHADLDPTSAKQRSLRGRRTRLPDDAQQGAFPEHRQLARALADRAADLPKQLLDAIERNLVRRLGTHRVLRRGSRSTTTSSRMAPASDTSIDGKLKPPG
jgi:hypothetical protein